METLGDRIRKARRAKRLTQKHIADLFSINRVNITQWESNTTRPDPSKLSNLAEHLGVSIDWLITGEGQSAQTPSTPPNEIDDLTKFAIEQAGDIVWKITNRDARINIDPDKFRDVVVSTVEAAVLEKVESGHLTPEFTENIVKFQIRKI